MLDCYDVSDLKLFGRPFLNRDCYDDSDDEVTDPQRLINQESTSSLSGPVGMCMKQQTQSCLQDGGVIYDQVCLRNKKKICTLARRFFYSLCYVMSISTCIHYCFIKVLLRMGYVDICPKCGKFI